jgi:hypothetical protein
MRRSIAWVLAAAPLLFACSSKSSAKPPETPREATVELASVTLADDCGDAARPPPPPTRAAASPPVPAQAPSSVEPPADEAVAPSAMAARCAGPNCGHDRRACDQTSMQLALAAPAGAATAFAVKKVELLDERGALLGELTPRKATAWSDAAGAYQPWDQNLAAGAKLNVSYALSSPDWNKLDGGRWNAHTKKFQLRVTLTVGTADRTVEKKAISPAEIEPAVPT